MTRRALLALLALALVPAARAAAPQFWRLEGTLAFLEGELESVSLDSDATLRLGPAARSTYELDAPNAWALAAGADGALVVGTGNEGRVYRVEGEEGRVILDAAELEVHAVAAGPDGTVYAGTSPEGAVHAIAKDGTARVFFDPPDKYIWALAFDAQGRLLVATGGEARVYRIAPDGSSETLLESTETHVLSLAVGSSGQVFAGSAPHGIVYRVEVPGRAFVLLDSDFAEIKSLAVGPDGDLFAAAVGAGTPSGAGAPSPPSDAPGTAPPPVAEVTVTESFTIPSVPAPVFAPTAGDETGGAASPKGAVVRIAADGAVETLWRSAEDSPHSLAWSGRGVLVGTGDRGKVYRVDEDARWTLMASLPTRHVTAIVSTGEAEARLVTSNPARVYLLPPASAARGTFTSGVHDAETVSGWGQIRWEGRAPADTSVRLETRSGNTSSPDSTWSEWTEAAAGSRHASIRSASARFLQVRLTLEGTAEASPEVEAVSAAFLQRNLRPDVRTVTVHPPGEVFQKPISVSGEPEILGLEPDPLAEAGADRTAPGTPPVTSFSRKLQHKGLRTFSWTAQDPNRDALLYEVLYRAIGDTRWRRLRRGIGEPVVAWDTSAVPDGRYVVRVVASDSPDNPPAMALTGHRDSSSFEVDNTPPSLEAGLVPGSGDRIRATARDGGSPIRRLEFAIDAGRWQEVHPQDGINDSTEETYEFTVPPTETSGARVVVLRVSDRLGNVATGRVDVP